MRFFKSTILAASLVLIAGVSYAQITAIRPSAISKPNMTQTIDPNAARAAPTVESLQQQIIRMRTKLREERATSANLREQINQIHSKGGSRVIAFCESQNLSRSTAGAVEDCNLSGYSCAPVSGLCRRDCRTTDDCAPGFACNTSNNRCELPPPPAEEDDGWF